jgi:hypothetical protein
MALPFYAWPAGFCLSSQSEQKRWSLYMRARKEQYGRG